MGVWKMDEHERDLRLVSLTYEVLRDLEMPTDEVTDKAVFLRLSRAFSDKATALADPRAAARKKHNELLPAASHSRLAARFEFSEKERQAATAA